MLQEYFGSMKFSCHLPIPFFSVNLQLLSVGIYEALEDCRSKADNPHSGLKYAAISVEYNEQDYDSISINTQRAAANVFYTGKK